MSLSFPVTTVGRSSGSQTVTLSNVGTGALTVISLVSSDAEFQVAGGTCAAGAALAPGASCTATITYTPSTAGATSASLTFTQSASSGASVVTLSGTGTFVVTSRPTSTYPTSGPEYLAFEQLNDERGACGFGYVTQAAALDQAAADANAYFSNRAAESLASARAYSHLEDATRSGFTGALPSDRAAFRGYTGSVVYINEDNATLISLPASPSSNNAVSTAQLESLLTSVYHVKSLMAPVTDIGFSFDRVTSADGYDLGRLNLVVGVGPGQRPQSSTDVRTYPCAGTTRVYGNFMPQNESPNPAPDLGAMLIGTPVYVDGPDGQILAVTAATITAGSGGPTVPLRILTYDNDPFYLANGVHALSSSEAFLMPLAPLVKGTSYTVTITGTSGGTPFTTSFSFAPSL